MAVFDFKKAQKDLYQPKTTPSLVHVPELVFLMIDGKGDPNTSAAYGTAIEILYGLSYTIKMSKLGGHQPTGYFDYVVPPLEGLWRLDDGGGFTGGGAAVRDKSKFLWTSMIRQPEFVTREVFEAAKATFTQKKPGLDLSGVRLENYAEGLCVQVLHIGSYDDEPRSVAALERYIAENGYLEDMSDSRHHHEIYLSDPRKTVPEKLKTVIRHPVRKEEGNR